MNQPVNLLRKKIEGLFLLVDGSRKQLALTRVKGADSASFLAELQHALEGLEAILSRENSRLAELTRAASRVKA